MNQYLQLLKDALSGEKNGHDRTGAGTIGTFLRNVRFDLSEEFPIVTTKRVYWKGVAEELMWFLKGETNIRPLLQKKVPIWTPDALRFNLHKIYERGVMDKVEVENAKLLSKKAKASLLEDIPLDEKRAKFDELMIPANELTARYTQKVLEDEEFAKYAADLGPIYGAQWRGTNGANNIDQILALEDMLKNNTHSRRKIVSAWNPLDVDKVALPPCHYEFSIYVSPETNKLSLSWKQRSCDTLLGVPFNIASYALLTALLAETHGFEKGDVCGTFEDLHVYQPHIPAAEEQLLREPKELPKLVIKNKKDSITEYTTSDFELVGYKPHPELENPSPMFGGLFL